MSPKHSYSVILPPAWTRIPLRRGTEAAIDAILDRSFEGLPRDSASPWRSELRKQLMNQAAAAREQGGLDLYLPTERRHDVTLPASFVVSQVDLPAPQDGERADPAAVLAALLGDDADLAPTTLDGETGIRRERLVPPDPAKPVGEDVGSRRVEYVVAVPGEQHQWLLVAFSTIGAGDPSDGLADVLVELFDAILTTFRWGQPSAA